MTEMDKIATPRPISSKASDLYQDDGCCLKFKFHINRETEKKKIVLTFHHKKAYF